MRYKRIAFFVCSNGFGHLKRTLLVVQELYRLNPTVKITIFCPESHISLANQEAHLAKIDFVEYETKYSENEVSWLSPGRVTVDHYDKCIEVLTKYKYLEDTSLIVSDNLVTPLNVFRNAVLMGSFLWHDVVRFRNPEVDRLISHERDVISTLNPNMLGLESMAMDAVKNETSFIPLPWFCSKYPNRLSSAKTKSVLFTGGGTGLINDLLAEICINVLKKDASLEVFADSKIAQAANIYVGSRIKSFSFKDKDFARLAAIVCRPGIGILTDCVRHSIPPITINDGYNKEIDHNAQRVAELKIGDKIDSSKSTVESIADRIIEIIASCSKRETYIDRLERQKCQGAEIAARYLLGRLEYGQNK